MKAFCESLGCLDTGIDRPRPQTDTRSEASAEKAGQCRATKVNRHYLQNLNQIDVFCRPMMQAIFIIHHLLFILYGYELGVPCSDDRNRPTCRPMTTCRPMRGKKLKIHAVHLEQVCLMDPTRPRQNLYIGPIAPPLI